MKEIQAILDLGKNAAAGEPLALATLVNLQGSAYRRPGARMLMTASGRSAGMISGGCLENDVRERAREVMNSGEARLVTYDSTSPDDIVFGMGLGCHGIVQVLIEPLMAREASGLLAFLSACGQQRETGRMATVFQSENASPALGARLLFWPDKSVTANFEDREMTHALSTAVQNTPPSRAIVRQIELANGGSASVLIETLAPPMPLAIFGGGEDAIPVAQFAKLLGWHVTVVDARPAYALPERFPTADAVLCLRPESLPDTLALSPDSLAMVMTHSFVQDKDLLRALLPLGLRYVGILGPKKRTCRLLDELAAEGATFTDECLARLHGPAGLDIGADAPEEVALSLLAEMLAILANRSGGQLRWRAGPIHEHTEPAPVAV